jgi:hypothetical protein
VHCLVTDSDLARVWVPSNPASSRIRYFAPTERAQQRLTAYGVAPERITLTGFPLPGELLGGPELPALRRNLAARLVRLDPTGVFREQHRREVEELLGTEANGVHATREAPLLTFAVGGAGAQAGLAPRFLPSLRPEIEAGRLRLALLAGVRRDVATAFRALVARAGLAEHPGVRVVGDEDLDGYFRACNALLAETDILWTKPSELSFFTGLGLPIVMAPSIGAQEDKNAKWLAEKNCGVPQDEPALALEWLADLVNEGVLAEKAFSGFAKNRKLGTYHVEEVLATGRLTRETHPLRR